MDDPQNSARAENLDDMLNALIGPAPKREGQTK